MCKVCLNLMHRVLVGSLKDNTVLHIMKGESKYNNPRPSTSTKLEKHSHAPVKTIRRLSALFNVYQRLREQPLKDNMFEKDLVYRSSLQAESIKDGASLLEPHPSYYTCNQRVFSLSQCTLIRPAL